MFNFTEPSHSNHRNATREPVVTMEVVAFETIHNETFITHYDVRSTNSSHKVKDRFEVHNPKVISPNSLLDKLNLKEGGLIDERVLVDNGKTLIWQYTPASGQNFYYKYNNKTIVSPIKWCNFVFKLVGCQLSVFAIQHKKRPTQNTRLYYAPLPNVFADGKICLGSCSLPKNRDIDAISECYFESVKTHLNNNNLLRGKKDTSDHQFYKWIKTKTENPIRVSELTPFGTLKDIL